MPILVPDRRPHVFRPGQPAAAVSPRQEDEAARLIHSERSGKAFLLWYVGVSVLWIMGTDALIGRFGSPTWVGSVKDILYLAASGFALQRVLRGYLVGIRRTHAEQVEAKRELVERLAMAAEYRDDETGGHNHRIARSAQIVGRALGLDEGACKCLYYAAALHDIGKIAVPDSILHKPGTLTPEERTQMKRHAELGAGLLAGSTHRLLQTSHDVALTHHERWDGGGYPRGLKEEEIPLEGRIVAVCDVFDALTSERPYKKAWAVAEATAEIRRGSGSHFDPAVVEAFLACLPAIVAMREEAPKPWSSLRSAA